MIKCNNCGEIINPDSLVKAPKALIKCPKCGKKLYEEKSNICPTCGAGFTGHECPFCGDEINTSNGSSFYQEYIEDNKL